MFDKKISDYHYLKYSDLFLNLIYSEKFNNQNRLRQSDYLNLLRTIGFEPVYLESDRSDNYREQLRNIKLNKRFLKYEIDDLRVMLKKLSRCISKTQ